jgi:hypothetical protein
MCLKIYTKGIRCQNFEAIYSNGKRDIAVEQRRRRRRRRRRINTTKTIGFRNKISKT